MAINIDKTRKRLRVIYRRIADIKPDPKNPRFHGRKQQKQLASSIRTFGFLVPLLVDVNCELIAGHARLMAAKELGLTEVPTIGVEHLSQAQKRAFMIADNRLTELSTWDDRLLAEQLKELSVVDLDFDLEITGFEMAEIDLRIEGLTSEPDEDGDPADEVPMVQTGPAVNRPGDQWIAGPHRFYNGSALDLAAYAALMQGELAHVVFADPPFNVKIGGNVSGLGAIHHREFMMASGEMTAAEYTQFLTKSCALLAANSVEGSLHFICMDWRHMAELLSAGQEVYSELKNVCVWVKDNAGMGSLYRSQYELVFVFKHGRGAHRNNVQLGRFGRNRSNVWHYPGANSFSRSGEEGNVLSTHPTPIAVRLVADALLDCSARGEVVLDPFLGSGTTVIAAQRTGRRCYGLELDPLYLDCAIRRWQAFTGELARHAVSGRLFNDMEGEVEGHHAE